MAQAKIIEGKMKAEKVAPRIMSAIPKLFIVMEVTKPLTQPEPQMIMKKLMNQVYLKYQLNNPKIMDSRKT